MAPGHQDLKQYVIQNHGCSSDNKLFMLTCKSPDIFAPARMPVAAGKNMANTEKKPLPSLKSGPKLSTKTSPEKEQNTT